MATVMSQSERMDAWDFDTKCIKAAHNLIRGASVVVRPHIVREHGISTLIQSIKLWVTQDCAEEAWEYNSVGGEAIEKEFRLWAEILPDGGARIRAKRVK
jgi:hypothetical protein